MCDEETEQIDENEFQMIVKYAMNSNNKFH